MKPWALTLLVVLAASSPATSQRAPAAASQVLPPVTWTCTMHPDVVEDKKGSCPICKMDLVAVRLVSVWTCPVHSVIEQDSAGTCRICRRALVPTTRALTFTCAGQPEISAIDPGRCADGTAMVARHAPRPHGDHNPRHGGLFFMAPDNWHHIEGAYPSAGLFRVYVYDDYSKPLSLARARAIRGRIVTKETFDSATRTTRELAAAPLVLSRNGAYFEARIDPLVLPAQMVAKIAFSAGEQDARFDFSFQAFSKDIVGAPIAPAPAPSSSAAPSAGAADGPTASLMKELKQRDEELAALVKDGSFGTIYVPALQAKDLALQIQLRQGSLPQKQAVEVHVKQLVTAAYQLDNYGDLGDAQKIAQAYRSFTAAISALASLLETHP